jgi:hypothetical protein
MGLRRSMAGSSNVSPLSKIGGDFEDGRRTAFDRVADVKSNLSILTPNGATSKELSKFKEEIRSVAGNSVIESLSSAKNSVFSK